MNNSKRNYIDYVPQPVIHYWNDRFADEILNSYYNLDSSNTDMIAIYKDAADALQKELMQAMQKAAAGTATRSDKLQALRLYGMYDKVQQRLQGCSGLIESGYNSRVPQGMQDLYKKLSQMVDVADFSQPNLDLMKFLANNTWQGSEFSTRIWQNNKKLAAEINNSLKNDILMGNTITEMAVRLNNLMNKGLYNAYRLVRTETMHSLNMASFQRYKDWGCTEVEFSAAQDERECPRCKMYDGKKYDISKITDVPPIHPHCRCTLIPVIESSKSLMDKCNNRYIELKESE